MMLCLALTPSEAAEMKMLLDRALNTLPPYKWPVWVKEYLAALEKAVDVDAQQTENAATEPG